MKQKRTDIKLHGALGDQVGSNWKLCISSVGEAMNAIEILSKKKLFKTLVENDKKGIQYRVLINGREFLTEKKLDANDLNSITDSELSLVREDLESIDVVPVIEGSGSNDLLSALTIIAGIILIIVGLVITIGLSWTGVGFAVGVGMVIAGVGLVAAGVIGLLTSAPDFEDFQDKKNKGSLLFDGPQQTTKEGGPVPVGYGRLLIGSHVVSASYEIEYHSVDEIGLTQ